MPSYRESVISGTKWQRACRVVIENPLDHDPTVTYVEEEVSVMADGARAHRLVDRLAMTIDDPSLMIPMVDPETNEVTETQYPLQLAQWILYSLYFYLAGKRDNAANTEPDMPGETP